MKINRAILSSNESIEYLDFWPIVSSAWSNLGIQPTLIYTGKESIKMENVYRINVENIDSAFLSQNIRLLAPCLFPEDICIISDIDNMPLSESYFQKNIAKIDENQFVVYRPDACPDDMISIMWNAAKGSTWAKIFNVFNEQEIINKLIDWYPDKYKIRGENWYFDQRILRTEIEKYKKQYPNMDTELNDEESGFNRLNRSKLKRRFKKFYIEGSHYSDFHMPRPYKKYKKIIDKVYNINFQKNP